MTVNLRGLFGKFSTDASTVLTLSVGPGSPTLVAASNPNRLAVVIYNTTGTLYVKRGLLASTTNYSHRLTANTELTIGSEYTGPVTVIKQTGTTDVNVTII